MLATKAEMLLFLPGGGRIPFTPNGPRVAQVKLEKVAPAKVQLLASSVADGVNPLFRVAKKGVVARLITSLSGLRPNDT